MTDIERRLAQEYEQKRQEAERQRDDRLRAVLAHDPEIGVLQDAQRRRFAKATRDMMADRANTDAITLALKRDIQAMQTEIEQRLRALRLPADELEVHYGCKKCSDTGYLGEFGGEVCACRRLRKVQLMREQSGIANAMDQTFATFDRAAFPTQAQFDHALAAKKLCERYADTLLQGAKLNLVLMGESGLGKTFLLNCVADSAIQHGIPAMVVTAFHMLGAMRDYHFGNTADGSLLEQMMRCELLLIDDLGSEPMLRNITVEYLFMLLNERMTRRLHTVIATNLTPGELQNRYNERVVSRLMDRTAGELILLTGSDLRYTKR